MPENVWAEYADKLAGGWKCVSYEVFDGNGPNKKLISKPHGEHPLGRVLISRNGFLSAQMSFPDRVNKPLPSGKPWIEGNDDEVAHVARGHSMYCGHLELFELGDDKLQWQTRVVISSDPSRMGGLEVRNVDYYQEDDKWFMILQPENDMILEVPSTQCLVIQLDTDNDGLQDGTRVRGVLKWEKFE